MRLVSGVLFIMMWLELPVSAAAPGLELRGFSPAQAERERALEARFADIPSAAGVLESLTAITARPHYAGTGGDYRLALTLRDRLRAFGLPAELQTLSATVETPRTLRLEVAPPAALTDGPPRRGHAFPIRLDLRESRDAGGAATLPFEAGSADGDVSAPLVFVGRGTEADLALLAHANVDLRGAVVLVRLGSEAATSLTARAQARGAAGVILYRDPADVGAAESGTLTWGVKRGWLGGTVNIPVLPISAANAATLLGTLSGPPGPPGWTGALPVTYPLARGPGRVHLVVRLTRKRTTLWNTVATIAGTGGAQSVVLGARRDAWVAGAVANGAGVSALLEVARGLAALMTGGWQPQRSLVLAFWDGGEIGGLGSRAYVFSHAVDIPRGCFAYLDLNSTVTGPTFGAHVSAALAPLLIQTVQAIRDPLHAEATLAQRWTHSAPPIAPPQSASADIGNFLIRAGIPVTGLAFGGPAAAIDTAADTLAFATINDPNFIYTRTVAQVYGTLALRLADAAAVPYTFSGYVPLIRTSIARLRARAVTLGLVLMPPQPSLFTQLAVSARHADLESLDGRRDADRLEAARILDELVYGERNGAAVLLPELESAVAAHDQRQIETANAELADGVRRAVAVLRR